MWVDMGRAHSNGHSGEYLGHGGKNIGAYTIWTALYFWTKLSILEVEEESIKCTVSGADRTSDCLMILLY